VFVVDLAASFTVVEMTLQTMVVRLTYEVSCLVGWVLVLVRVLSLKHEKRAGHVFFL